jgi:UDP-3-O-[3-hydroxymyristoyl] glucosamine N-acyltransferase
MPAQIHPDARVMASELGDGTRVWQFAVVMKGAAIGRDCNISSNVLVESDVRQGDPVAVKSGVQLWTGVTAEDDVFIGPNATFTNDFLPRSRQPATFKPTLLKSGCSIGANANIVC